MTPEERAEFDLLTKPPAWTPFPESPQELAYHSPAHEIYFGGAAGAGKTALGVGLAITCHRRSLILRRNAVNTVEIVDQLKRFARGGQWRSSGYGGMMRTADGRVVEVGGCDHEDDKDKYQGRPHDLIVFDEGPHFTQTQFRFISAWNRHEDPKQRCRIILPGNPPTRPEEQWIKIEFAPWLDPDFAGRTARPGELRWYTVLKDELVWLETGEPFMHNGERITPRSRTFIPGRLHDNPILAATDYGARLQALPEPLRSQLLYGDMNAGTEDDAWQTIPTAWVRQAMARWKPEGGSNPMTDLGVDVARGGKDKTVLAPKHGRWFAKLIKYAGKETADGPAVEHRVIKVRRDDAVVRIDVIGIGSSAYDCLKQHDWFETVPVNNANAASGTDRSGKLRFTNVRAASWWRLREDLDPANGLDLSLPPDNELLTDLTAPRYKVLASGIQIEKKEDVADRIGRSPDCGDAVVMANWNQQRRSNLPRFFRLDPTGHRGMRIVLVNNVELAGLVVENRALLITVADPKGVMPDAAGTVHASGPVQVDGAVGDRLPHGLTKLLDSFAFQFAAIEPGDHQATWAEPVPPFGRPAQELLLQKDDARRFWGWFLKRREPGPEVIVVAGDERARTVAWCLCDVLGLKRSDNNLGRPVWSPADPEDRHFGEPPCRHAHATLKAARNQVRG